MSQGSPNAPKLQSKPTSSRLPPPSLFQGPPSRNTSAIDLGFPVTQTTSRSNERDLSPSDALRQPQASRRPRGQSVTVPQSEHDRADAMWVEMQNTLAEVELSAENTNHLFSGDHARALEDLRHAQLALAQAWARSEGEENVDQKQANEPKVDTKAKDGQPPDPKSRPQVKSQPNNTGIEQETEADITMARKRREANDLYFQRVNAGVLDVVAKLEDVALAMRTVEKASRDIWTDAESIASTAEATEDLSPG